MPHDLPGAQLKGSTPATQSMAQQRAFHIKAHAGLMQAAGIGEAGHIVMDSCKRETDAAPSCEIDSKELKLKDLVGQGEFGEVYRAFWRGRTVAAKVFKESNPTAQEVFKMELSALQHLRHPNIVTFLGACTRGKPHILVFELMTAGTLADVLGSPRRLMPERALSIALDLALGLAYLHSLAQGPMMHRDLKPSNLLITGPPHVSSDKLIYETGVVKLADFGLAQPLPQRDSSDINRKHRLTGEVGSYRFMAPEICLHKEYNEKADVWGFAMVLYQLMEHRAPFAGTDAVEAAGLAALQNQRPKFGRLAQACPTMQAVRRLLEQCWQEDPDARPKFPAIIATLELQLSTIPPKKGCIVM